MFVKKDVAVLRLPKPTNLSSCLSLALLLVSHLGAQAQTSGQTQTPSAQPQVSKPNDVPSVADDRYRIGPDDVIEIRVFNRPQISRDSVRVDARGMIRMPLIEEDIQAACLTEGELSLKLQKLYSEYLVTPQIDVFVKEFNSNPVSLVGAVGKPGRFQLQRKIRLMELLTLAGGPTPSAGRYVQIFRSDERLKCGGGGDQQSADDVTKAIIAIELNQVLKGSDPANPFLQPGDIVNVPEGDQIFVVGNVVKPSAIPLRDPITISNAVALAGGYLDDSQTDKVRIIRQVPGVTAKKELIVNLEAINRRGANDVTLEAGDIVEIPVSSGHRFKRALTYTIAPALVYTPLSIVR